jgi:hypothetical protein
MGKWIKQIAIVVLIVFVVYFFVAFPTESAGAITTLYMTVKGWIVQAYHFVTTLG